MFSASIKVGFRPITEVVSNDWGGMDSVFIEWFAKNSSENKVNENIFNKKVKKSITKYDVTIYMGTWCGDSRKEVPRMIKALKTLDYDMSRLKIQALDQYKQAMNREELGLNIHRVPTMVFAKNGKEKGRIVEHPINSIEQDISQILTSNKYKPNYYGLEVLHKAIVAKGFNVLNDEKLLNQIKPLVKEDFELYKYGVIYFRNNEYEKAIAIYDFNAKLFPKSDRPYQNKGISYYKMGELEKAKVNLEKALKLNPENNYVQKYLGLIADKESSQMTSKK
jgi:tetratricopeptide (TPR) repeat protein